MGSNANAEKREEDRCFYSTTNVSGDCNKSNSLSQNNTSLKYQPQLKIDQLKIILQDSCTLTRAEQNKQKNQHKTGRGILV